MRTGAKSSRKRSSTLPRKSRASARHLVAPEFDETLHAGRNGVGRLPGLAHGAVDRRNQVVGATKFGVRAVSMRAAGEHGVGREVSEELATIVLRADGLGFCHRRVATALGITAHDLAQIERRAGLPSSPTDAPSAERRPR